MLPEETKSVEGNKHTLSAGINLLNQFREPKWWWLVGAFCTYTGVALWVGGEYEKYQQSILKASTEVPVPSAFGPPSLETSIQLAALFGKSRTGQARVQLDSPGEHERLMNQRFATALKKIQIVTLRGQWLHGNQLAHFLRSLHHVDIEVLMLDFKDNELYQMVQDAVVRDGNGPVLQPQYAEDLFRFAQHTNESTHFKVGVTDFFPVTRFTIFDDKAVSFILAPGISGGPDAINFFSEDPFLVDSYRDLYRRIRARATLFASVEAAQEYINRR